jgi:diaminopimelate decarboxylase
VFLKSVSLGQVKEDDFVAILDGGAYGYSMASVYNLHELPNEICI